MTQLEEHHANCLAAVKGVTAEEVIDVAPFNRRGLYTNKALGKFGALPYLLGKAQAKAQAGGLPENFLLVATPTHLVAFDYKARGRSRDKYEVGQELASWARDAVKVSWEDGPPYQIDVTIETPGEEENVLCRTGKQAWSEVFLRLVSEPAMAP